MRAVIQRVSRASVSVDSRIYGEIGPGLLVLLGVQRDDTDADADYIAAKTLGLRVFPDVEGKMNRSVVDTGGSVLIISQFTLFGDVRRGKRPSFIEAAEPALADDLYERVSSAIEAASIPVQKGIFGAHMAVSLINDGPVTIQLDSRRLY